MDPCAHGQCQSFVIWAILDLLTKDLFNFVRFLMEVEECRWRNPPQPTFPLLLYSKKKRFDIGHTMAVLFFRKRNNSLLLMDG